MTMTQLWHTYPSQTRTLSGGYVFILSSRYHVAVIISTVTSRGHHPRGYELLMQIQNRTNGVSLIREEASYCQGYCPFLSFMVHNFSMSLCSHPETNPPYLTPMQRFSQSNCGLCSILGACCLSPLHIHRLTSGNCHSFISQLLSIHTVSQLFHKPLPPSKEEHLQVAVFLSPTVLQQFPYLTDLSLTHSCNLETTTLQTLNLCAS